ncbi:hypothetical protein U0355_09245 [Salimicrobium sp. PL1-032A]|uniref:hypothetical protein n=1 Tax=Salimicrobium sp. PL1-032A TaxID=3095364 RepID=UPI00326029E6
MKAGKTTILIYFFVLVLLLLSACSQKPEFEQYEGNALEIAVVGEPPNIREEQVEFKEISLEEVKEQNIDSYDGVFIMNEYLSQASRDSYAGIYSTSSIPFFFISAKSHVPFIMKDSVFEDSWEWSPGTNYTVGILDAKKDGSLTTFGYGLNNDEKTEDSVKGMYSAVFKKVEEY